MDKKPLASVKDFVSRNKTKILAGTTIVATTIVVLQQRGFKLHNDFLREHDLFDEFYADNEE